jgi:hypothetical protein
MPSTDKRDDVTIVRDDLTKEVMGDAEAVAADIFRRDGPDIQPVNNQLLDEIYRRKWLALDREWLQREARRDPKQFLAVAKRLNVLPPEDPKLKPIMDSPQAVLAQALGPTPAPPVAPTPGSADPAALQQLQGAINPVQGISSPTTQMPLPAPVGQADPALLAAAQQTIRQGAAVSAP